jgi:hypothetical protein
MEIFWVLTLTFIMFMWDLKGYRNFNKNIREREINKSIENLTTIKQSLGEYGNIAVNLGIMVVIVPFLLFYTITVLYIDNLIFDAVSALFATRAILAGFEAKNRFNDLRLNWSKWNYVTKPLHTIYIIVFIILLLA